MSDGGRGRRVGFLFNHDQLHQVAHSLPVALALARTGAADVVLASTHPRLTAEIRRLAGGALPAPLVELDLTRAASRLAAATLDELAPVRKLLMYGDNAAFFRGLDVLVVAEKTALRLKAIPGLARMRLVHTRHGAGDRAIGFDRASALFDRVLVSGAKVAERLVAQSGVDPARIRVVGYPKFDLAGAPPSRRLFDDDRPVVLYNPHGSPHLSSWYAMGRQVLDAFTRSARYNLIFAPHVMLFRRPVTISIDRLAVAFPGSVPRRARAAANILVDLGSPACSDMTYVEAADLYLGDVSSQVYEFLRRPRPCVFLNPHRRAFRDDPDFLHWRAGRVIEEASELEEALEQAPGEHAARYAAVQHELFAYTFDLTDEPSSERAAAAILQMIGEAQPRG